MRKPIKGAPSGKTYEWQRPARHVHWRHGRIAQSFHTRFIDIEKEDALRKKEERRTAEEKGLQLFESFTEDEAERLERYMTDVVASGLGIPKEEVPDIPEADFWWLFGQAVYSVPEAKVETSEGVMTVEEVGNFRPESELSPAGENVPDVSTVSGTPNGNIRSYISG